MSVPPRTTPLLVQGVLGDDYGNRVDGTPADLSPYIRQASIFTDNVQKYALAKPSPYSHSAAELVEIETAVAAHFYTKSDPTYTSKSTSGASGSFIRNSENPEPYRDLAIMLDASGMVNALFKRNFIQTAWLGKPPSQQIDYNQRN